LSSLSPVRNEAGECVARLISRRSAAALDGGSAYGNLILRTIDGLNDARPPAPAALQLPLQKRENLRQILHDIGSGHQSAGRCDSGRVAPRAAATGRHDDRLGSPMGMGWAADPESTAKAEEQAAETRTARAAAAENRTRNRQEQNEQNRTIPFIPAEFLTLGADREWRRNPSLVLRGTAVLGTQGQRSRQGGNQNKFRA